MCTRLRMAVVWVAIVVVYTDLLSKELHRRIGVGIVVTSANLHGVMVTHWPRMPEMSVRFLLWG